MEKFEFRPNKVHILSQFLGGNFPAGKCYCDKCFSFVNSQTNRVKNWWINNMGCEYSLLFFFLFKCTTIFEKPFFDENLKQIQIFEVRDNPQIQKVFHKLDKWVIK